MRWQTSRRSDNVEEGQGGGIPRLPALGGGALLLVLLLSWILGGDPLALLQQLNTSGPTQATEVQSGAPIDSSTRDFVSAVLGETEDVWREIFRQDGSTYQDPKLVLFAGAERSPCGLADVATGPFYCPGDRKVYLDVTFFKELSDKLGAPGDFAQAYVIAHEVGHHVQNQMGITDKVEALRGRLTKEEFNAVSVRLELQADFLAGVWANHAQKKWQILEPGDIEEALNAASQIGDDRLQLMSQGYVVPDAFTHGTSAQRVRWFKKGLESGDMRQGDTFSAEVL
jgi:predicted metalloprotease